MMIGLVNILLAWFLPLAQAFVPIQRWRTAAVSNLGSRLYSTLSAEQEHAREVFRRFDPDGSGTISSTKLKDMLVSLEVDVTDEESLALFKYLDEDGDGGVDFSEFLAWYSEASGAAKELASNFQSLLIGRRTVDYFDSTPISDEVLFRAIQCAIAAPNRRLSEPWRFIKVGPKTVEKVAALNMEINKGMETDDGEKISNLDWTTIPGWCVVTTKLSPTDPGKELEDFKSVSCAIQNFMLSLWSEGIGSKWTSGPVQKTQEFADLCGVDTGNEKVVGCIWYGFARGGLTNADPKRREKGVEEVLCELP